VTVGELVELLDDLPAELQVEIDLRRDIIPIMGVSRRNAYPVILIRVDPDTIGDMVDDWARERNVEDPD